MCIRDRAERAARRRANDGRDVGRARSHDGTEARPHSRHLAEGRPEGPKRSNRATSNRELDSH
eukprot:1814836-Lingulodinium_polyedra.AAC.1